jgi:hypothetical protein
VAGLLLADYQSVVEIMEKLPFSVAVIGLLCRRYLVFISAIIRCLIADMPSEYGRKGNVVSPKGRQKMTEMWLCYCLSGRKQLARGRFLFVFPIF